MHRTPSVLCPFPLAAALCAIAGALPAQAVLVHSGTGAAAHDQLGSAVAGIGDVDGDGFADFAVGAPFDDANGIDAGAVRLISGRTGNVLHTLFGDGAGGQFGQAIAGGVDVDGDRVPDLLVGSPGDDGGPGVDSGFVRLIAGGTWQTLRTMRGIAAGDRLGDAVGFVGDIDGDGVQDFGGGAPLADAPGVDSGRAIIWSGANAAVLWTGTGATGDHYGHCILGVGDTDGDLRDDFLVSAPWSDQVASKCGSAMVYSGRTRAQLQQWFGTDIGHEFGTSAVALGDVDHDGRADVAVAAPEDKTNGDDSGSVRVFSGSSGAVLWWWYGNSGYDYFGHSIGAGDFDGDGFADMMIGAPRDEGPGVPGDAGIVRVYSCQTGLLLHQIGGVQGFEQFGRAVGSVGDVNGDGFADVLCGAPLHDGPAGADSGAYRVHCGFAATPLIGTFGGGCPAAAPLQLGYAAPARVGQPLTIQVQQGPANGAIGWLLFDLGPPLAQAVPLGAFGFPGCEQLVALDTYAIVVVQNGAASLSLTLPAAMAPCGLSIANQAVCLDPAAPGGFSFSNGGRAVIAR